MAKSPHVCPWCVNKMSDVCEKCGQEGRYRFLEADNLPVWEAPPELPSMRVMVDMPAAERLAMLWLVARYTEKERSKGDA